jgi:hypothetical protein
MVNLHLDTGSPTVNSLITDSIWRGNAPAGEWCAWWATYIARATGVGRHTGSNELYNSLPHSSYAMPGDFIYYVNSQTTGHTGFVIETNNGVATRTIEGNAHSDPSMVWSYPGPWGDYVGFAHPSWGSTTVTEGDDVPTLYSAVDDTGGYRLDTETGGSGRPLTANVWTNLYIDPTDLTQLTFTRDNKIVDGEISYIVSGLPAGAVMKSRFVKITGSGTSATVDASHYAAYDAVGSGATSFRGESGQKMGVPSGSQYGLRAQIMSTVPGVTLLWSEIRWLEWPQS